MCTYNIQHLSAQMNEAFWLFLCLNCGVYDAMLTKEFIDFFLLKAIDNFKISKINVKFEHQFIAPSRNIPFVTFMHDFITEIDYIH